MDTFQSGSGTSSSGGDGPAATNHVSRMVEFQRNASFVAFILVVVMCCFLILIGNLRAVITPLIWATFFALPLQRAVVVLSDLEIRCVSGLLALFTGPRHPSLPVPFRHFPGRKFLWVESNQATLVMLEKVNNPLAGCPCHRRRVGSIPVAPGRTTAAFTSCCRRRLRIKTLESTSALVEPVEPSGLMVGGNYHLTAIHEPAAGGGLNLQLCVDGSTQYPVLFEHDVSLHQEMKGTLEVDKTSTFSWMLAIFFVIVFVLIGVGIFSLLVYFGAQNLIDNIQHYVDGVNQLFDWIGSMFNGREEEWKSIQKAITDFLTNGIPAMAEELLASTSGFLMQALFMIIYLLFWLVEPIPVSSTVSNVFKQYLLLKTSVCLLFASLMSLLLWALNVSIWPLFFVLSFLLNYVPEIGPMLCGFLSVVVVLFDGSTKEVRQRLINTLILAVVGMLIKVVTANVIEMRMYATRGGEFMRMHPVVLLAMMFFGQVLLGITGMFLAVPVVAAVKYYLVVADMPRTFLDPLLVFIEGNEMAPHMNVVDRRRAGRKDLGMEMRSQHAEQAEARAPLLQTSPSEINDAPTRIESDAASAS